MLIPEIAYWFVKESKLPNGDGRVVVLGETLSVEPPLVLCRWGLHWSEHPYDALTYATGNLLYKVKPGGEFLFDENKGCSTHRTHLAIVDAKEMLKAFARNEALSVVHLWDAPPIVKKFLETGDECLKEKARTVACNCWRALAEAAANKATYAATYAAAAAAEAAANKATYAAAAAADEAVAAAALAAGATNYEYEYFLAKVKLRFRKEVDTLFEETSGH